MQSAAEDLLLDHDLAVPHVCGALDLALDVRRIQGAAAVVRGGDLVDRERPGVEVDRHLRHRRLVRIRRRRSHARALVAPADPGRRLVAARGDERAVRALGDVRRLDERQKLLRILQVVDTAIRGGEPLDRNAELLRRGLEQQRAQLQRGVLDRVAGHHRHAARVRAKVDRRERGVAGHDVDVLRQDTQHFGRDGREHVVGALPDLCRAAHHGHAAAAVDADLRT